MKHQTATTPEQSKRLLACGVKPETADMYLSINLNEGENYGKYSTHIRANNDISMETIMLMRDYQPAWSLSVLLTDVIPPKIITGVKDETFTHRPELKRCKDGWMLILFAIHAADTPIESAVQCVEWLTSHNYSLNNIEL